MYQKILVPLDGSNLAECTLEHVKAIATGCSVPQVILLFVMQPTPSSTHEVSIPFNVGTYEAEGAKVVKESAEAYLKKTAETLQQDGVNISWAIENGSAAEEILKYSQVNDVDLIIMSTHGRSGVTRWAMGSVADRVIRTSAAPVLLTTPKECRAKT